MNNLFFWNYWKSKTEKRFYIVTLSIFCLALLWYFTTYFVGDNFMIRWEKVSETKAQPVVIDSFDKNLFQFQINADSFLIVENYKASNMDLNFTATNIYLILLLFGLVLLLTTATFMSKTWYIVIGSVLILYLATLNTELLYLFGSDQKIFLLIAFVVYVPLSYYFNAFVNEKRGIWTSFLFRFFAFALITMGMAFLIYQFSEVPHPEMFITNFGIIIPIVLTVSFIIFNAHEVINGILYLVTNAANASSKNTLTHFIVLSSIYMLNLFYAYLLSINAVNFGILYINSFILLGITFVLGIWGFAKRQSQYEGIMAFAPIGAYLYSSLAIISLATISYFFATANDALVEVMYDITLYAHLGLGFGFLGYVLTNFYAYIRANKKVYTVVYQPNKTGFVWVYVMGVVVMFLLFSRSNFFTYRQVFAGYYNGLADTYRASGDMFLSEQYHKTSLGYDYRNHKANYTLGAMARETGNEVDAYLYFDKAISKQASPFAFAQISDLLLQRERLVDAIFTLQKGVNRFPKSGELHLKLGMLYTETKNLGDSAFYYLDKAKSLLHESGVAAANIYAILLKDKLLVTPDSVKKMLELKDDLNTDNNELVLFNSNGLKTYKGINNAYLPDSLIGEGKLCYFYNYALNRMDSEDSTIWKKLDTYRKTGANGEVMSFLDLVYILRNRKTGENINAYKVIDNLYNSLKDVNAFYGNLAGLMMIEQDNYPKAIKYLASASRLDEGQARLNYAIALSEVVIERQKAIEIWQNIAGDTKADSMHRFIAKDMLRLILPDSTKNLIISQLDDISKYRFVHYNHFGLTDQTFNDILKTIQEPNYQLLTAIDRIHYYLNENKPTFAEAIRNSLIGFNGISPEIQQELIFADLKLLYKLKKIKEIGNLIEGFKPTTAREGYKNFYTALFLDSKNDSLNAENLFKKAMRGLPMHYEIPMELAVHYNKRKQSEKAYNLLISALDLYLDYHEYPPALYEMYILQCLDMNYVSFAEDAILRLEEIVNPTEFAFFKRIFDVEMEKIKAKLENWN
jgi:hypothetical protein